MKFWEDPLGSVGDLLIDRQFASAFWPTALTLAAGLLKGDGANWHRTKEGVTYTAAQEALLQRERLEAEKEMIAQRIAGELERAKLEALASSYGINARLQADLLAEELKARRGIPEVLERAGENIVAALLGRGELATKGFGNMASTLAAFRR